MLTTGAIRQRRTCLHCLTRQAVLLCEGLRSRPHPMQTFLKLPILPSIMPLLAAFPLQRHIQKLSHPALEADIPSSGCKLCSHQQTATVESVLKVAQRESPALDRPSLLFEGAICNSLNDGASSHTCHGKTARSL